MPPKGPVVGTLDDDDSGAPTDWPFPPTSASFPGGGVDSGVSIPGPRLLPMFSADALLIGSLSLVDSR